MIKFFRNIRKSLLVENRFRKYLLYAIGEIVLVVIGILIALQINDWSGQQKLERSNISLMERMQEELQLNIDRLQYLDTEYYFKDEPYGYTPFLARIDSGLTYINDGLDAKELLWMLSKSSFFPGGLYNMSHSVYQEILSSGRFNSLGPENLTNQIQRYYQLIDREELYTISTNQKAESAWDDCKYGFNDLKEVYDYHGREAVTKQDWYLDQQSKNYIDLKAAMRQSYISVERNRRHAYTMIAEAKSLKEALEIEIQSKR